MNLETLRGVFGRHPFTAREAAQALGIGSAASALNRWKQAGILARTGRGVYCFLETPRTAAIGIRLERMDVERRDEDSIRTLAEVARRRWEEALSSGRVQRVGNGYRLRVQP